MEQVKVALNFGDQKKQEKEKEEKQETKDRKGKRREKGERAAGVTLHEKHQAEFQLESQCTTCSNRWSIDQQAE